MSDILSQKDARILALQVMVADRDAQIERLTRERDEARKWQSVAAELSDKLHGTPCAEIRWEYERQDLQSRAETAERKVEKLREAIGDVLRVAQPWSSAIPVVLDRALDRLDAALAETEKGDE